MKVTTLYIKSPELTHFAKWNFDTISPSPIPLTIPHPPQPQLSFFDIVSLTFYIIPYLFFCA